MTISTLGTGQACGYRAAFDSWTSASRGRHCSEGAPAPSTMSSTSLGYRRTERTALYIETQEGDIVRLRIKVRDSLAASGTNDGSGTEIAVTSKSQLRISFQVEGDLNADELAAIQSVVEQAAELATDFFAGDLPEAFAAAAALDIDGSQLARVGLKLSLREQGTYTSVGTRPLPAPPPAEDPVPATASSTAPPAATAETAASTAATDDAAPAEAPQVPAPTEEPATPTPTNAQPNVAGMALSLIADFLEGLLDTLAATTPGDNGAGAASVDMSLRLHIYRAALVEVATSQPATEPEATSGVPLAAETLDALAAAHQPPLATEA